MPHILSNALRSVHAVMSQRYRRVAFIWLVVAILFAIFNYEYQLNKSVVLVWRAQLEYCKDHRLALPLALLIVTVVLKVVVLVLIILTHFYTLPFMRSFYDCRKRQQYATFIVRRLFAQVEQALQKCPKHLGLATASDYRRAMEEAFDAIDLFRRDVNKVFYSGLFLRHNSADDLYAILDEEEAQLHSAGYCNIDVPVDEHFLKQLCKPESYEDNFGVCPCHCGNVIF